LKSKMTSDVRLSDDDDDGDSDVEENDGDGGDNVESQQQV